MCALDSIGIRLDVDQMAVVSVGLCGSPSFVE